jgi:hypothetical protein
MVEMGVLDPTKVTRTALQNAASVAGLMLTTDAWWPNWRRQAGRRRHARHGAWAAWAAWAAWDGYVIGFTDLHIQWKEQEETQVFSWAAPKSADLEQEETQVSSRYPPSCRRSALPKPPTLETGSEVLLYGCEKSAPAGRRGRAADRHAALLHRATAEKKPCRDWAFCFCRRYTEKA